MHTSHSKLHPCTVAEFQFSQPVYNVSEDTGTVGVCLELVSGELGVDVPIEVTIFAASESTLSIFLTFTLMYNTMHVHFYTAGNTGSGITGIFGSGCKLRE